MISRLKVKRTKDMKNALATFIEEVKGRPYKMNILELWRALRTSNSRDNLNTIFCSQLVAAAYQRMGLLSEETASNNYLPVDFARACPLLKGTLEPIMLVPQRRRTKLYF